MKLLKLIYYTLLIAVGFFLGMGFFFFLLLLNALLGGVTTIGFPK